MAQQGKGIKRIWILSASAILVTLFLTALQAHSNGAKIATCAVLLLTIFASLIYFQLRFYREGDEVHIRSLKHLPSTSYTAAYHLVKSPHHRAIWENLEQTRILMRYKEQEFLQARLVKEKQALGLPPDEEILFMTDRSRLYLWPSALLSVTLLFMASVPSGQLPASVSFACLISGLLGLLVLSTSKFGTRYYLTNFRILIRHKRPAQRADWNSLGYPRISELGRVREFFQEGLTIKSGEETIRMKGLSKQELQTVLDIMQQKLP
jgi:hypothetical protein